MTVLVIAPHADDEVLGVGGTIAKLVAQGREVQVAVVTGHGRGEHFLGPPERWDRVRSECRSAMRVLGCAQPIFRDLPAACLDALPAHEVNRVVSELMSEIQPEEIYVPFAYDLHKDHAAVSYAVSVATRPYLPFAAKIRRILAYETLTETHLMPPYMAPAFQPSVYIDISATLDTKLEAIRAYKSQIQPDTLPRSAAGLRALAKLRGSHIGVEAAEAFVLLGEYQR